MPRLLRAAPASAVLASAVLAGGSATAAWAQTAPALVPEGFWPTALPFDLPLLVVVAALAVWTAGLAAQRLGASAALGELSVGLVAGALWPGLVLDVPLPLLAATGFATLMLAAGLENARHAPRADHASAPLAPVALAMGALWGPFLAVVAGLVALVVVVPPATVGGGVLVAVALSAGVVGLRPRDARLPHVAALSTLPLVLGVLALSPSPAALAGRLAGLLVLGAVAYAGRKGLGAIRLRLRGVGQTTLFAFTLVVAAAHAFLAGSVGWPAALGAGLAGYSVGRALRSTPQADDLSTLVRHAGAYVVAPFLFAWLGFVAARGLHAGGETLASFGSGVWVQGASTLDPAVGMAVVGAGLSLAVLAIGGRFGGLLLASRAARLARPQALELGWALVPRGGVTAYLLLLGAGAGLVPPMLLAAATLAVLATLLVDPLAARRAARIARDASGSHAARTGTVIVGAGPLARRLALLLDGPVALIDRNTRNAEAAEAAGLRVVTASALDTEALRDAGAPTACYLLALTGNPQLNRAAADIARTTFGVPHVLVPDLSGRAEADGGDETLFGDGFALGDWEYHASRGHVRLDEAPLDAVRVVVPTAERLPFALRRDGIVRPYFRGLGIEVGDRLLSLVRTDRNADPSRDRFEALVRKATVLDLDGPLPMVMFFDRVGHMVAERLGIEPERLSVLLMQREADSGSVVLPGLAIPHAVVPGSGRFEMVIARVKGGGIAFPNQTQPVHAAFVLVSTPDERTFHLRALAGVAHVVQRDGFEEGWASAASAEALRALLLER